VLAGTDAPCYVVSEALAEEVTGFHVHRGALASLERKPLPALAEVLDAARTVLVLEDVVDHTNVGAIMRSGAALGCRRRAALAALRRPALPAVGEGRPWAPSSPCRGPASTTGTTPCRHWRRGASRPSRSPWPTTPSPSTRRCPASTAGPGVGHGGPRALAALDRLGARRAVIPMAAGIDSLNVAAACAVACYVAQRR
jgi:hypothetical protein